MSRRKKWIAVLALGLAVSLSIAARTNSWTALISMQYPDVNWVDSETLSDWMAGPANRELVLLDVRSPEEQRVSHLREARHLDLSDPDVEALTIPASATVVVYCSIGYRSATVIEALEQAGIQNIYNLEGGIFGWANQDRPVYRGTERVHEVHPLNRAWGLLLRRNLRAEY